MGILLFPGGRLELERHAAEIQIAHQPEIHPPVVAEDLASRRPLASHISEFVFSAPDLDWRLETAGEMLGLRASALSRRLMKEGESLRELLRRQRLARFAYDLLAGVASNSAPAYGFSDMCRLENAFYDRFGVSTNQLEALVDSSPTHHKLDHPRRKVA